MIKRLFFSVAAAAAFLSSGAAAQSPDSCKQGWVWREADVSDHVCVTPQTRAQTAADNAAQTKTKEKLS
jgi:hypothetical protein